MGSSATEAFDPALGVHIDIQPIGPKIHRHGRVRRDPAERSCSRSGLHHVSPSMASPLPTRSPSESALQAAAIGEAAGVSPRISTGVHAAEANKAATERWFTSKNCLMSS